MAPRVNWNGYFRFVDDRLSNCLFTQLFTHRKSTFNRLVRKDQLKQAI